MVSADAAIVGTLAGARRSSPVARRPSPAARHSLSHTYLFHFHRLSPSSALSSPPRALAADRFRRQVKQKRRNAGKINEREAKKAKKEKDCCRFCRSMEILRALRGRGPARQASQCKKSEIHETGTGSKRLGKKTYRITQPGGERAGREARECVPIVDDAEQRRFPQTHDDEQRPRQQKLDGAKASDERGFSAYGKWQRSERQRRKTKTAPSTQSPKVPSFFSENIATNDP